VRLIAGWKRFACVLKAAGIKGMGCDEALAAGNGEAMAGEVNNASPLRIADDGSGSPVIARKTQGGRIDKLVNRPNSLLKRNLGNIS